MPKSTPAKPTTLASTQEKGKKTDKTAGKTGRHKQSDEQRQRERSDEGVQTDVEGIGNIPQGTIVLEGSVQEQSFLQKAFEHSDGGAMLLFLPPVGLFKVAAAILHAIGFFMRHGVNFPAQVLGVFQIADEFHRDDGYCKQQGRISQEHKEHRSLLQTCRARRSRLSSAPVQAVLAEYEFHQGKTLGIIWHYPQKNKYRFPNLLCPCPGFLRLITAACTF